MYAVKITAGTRKHKQNAENNQSLSSSQVFNIKKVKKTKFTKYGYISDIVTYLKQEKFAV